MLVIALKWVGAAMCVACSIAGIFALFREGNPEKMTVFVSVGFWLFIIFFMIAVRLGGQSL